MSPSTPEHDEPQIVARLRQMAKADGSVEELIKYIQQVRRGPDNTFAIVWLLRRAFHLRLDEARLVEGSALLGGTLYTPEQTEVMMRPLIAQYREQWAE